jgi:alanyl-tRNA synthetase
MGDDTCTIDILSMPFDHQKIKELEERVNRIIFENRPIHSYYVKDNSEINNVKIRKLQEVHEKLRMIEVDKFDLTACGGTHCHHTGEIGIIKITGWVNFKDKIRISFLCGYRALSDYQKKHLVIKNLSLMLTTSIDQLEEKITKMYQEKKDLNKQYSRMEKSLLRFEAEELKKTNGLTQKGLLMVSKIFLEKCPESLQQIAFLLINQSHCIAILGAEKPEPVLCIGRSRDYALQMGELMKKIIIEYHGKGGGSDFMAMGKFKKDEDMRNAYKRVTELI